MAQKDDQFVAAATEQQLLRGNAEHPRQLSLKIEGAAIGIAVHFADRFLHGFDRLRRRPQLVLVRRHLDDACQIFEAKLARDLFNRLARFVYA